MKTERKIKTILVSMWFNGRNVWVLANARKVGRHYQVSIETINELQSRLVNRRGATITTG
jgi:hypothetical protein